MGQEAIPKRSPDDRRYPVRIGPPHTEGDSRDAGEKDFEGQRVSRALFPRLLKPPRPVHSIKGETEGSARKSGWGGWPHPGNPRLCSRTSTDLPRSKKLH